MAVFRVERNTGYTVMSNHHLRNKELSLKAKGLLSQMLSLPEDWDYTLSGLSYINRESIDAIRTAVWELEKAGYITRRQGRDEKGKMTAIEYTIYEQPQPPELDCPVLENPTADIPVFPMLKTVEQMSKISGIGENKLRELMDSGELEYIQNGNRRLIADAAIWDWYHRAKTTAKPPARQGG